MSNFEVGDIVRCIERGAYGNEITPGKTYVILSIVPGFIRVKDDTGRVEGYYPSRFELVEKRKHKPFRDRVLEYIQAPERNIDRNDIIGKLAAKRFFTAEEEEAKHIVESVLAESNFCGVGVERARTVLDLPEPEPEKPYKWVITEESFLNSYGWKALSSPELQEDLHNSDEIVAMKRILAALGAIDHQGEPFTAARNIGARWTNDY